MNETPHEWLTLSRADFVTSGGVRLEKRGVSSDSLAARTAEDSRAGRDPVLAALKARGRRTEARVAEAVTPKRFTL